MNGATRALVLVTAILAVAPAAGAQDTMHLAQEAESVGVAVSGLDVQRDVDGCVGEAGRD